MPTKIHPFILFLSFSALLVVFWGFTKQEQPKTKELLTIAVDYRYETQSFHISQTNEESKLFIVQRHDLPKITKRNIKRLKSANDFNDEHIEIFERKLLSMYDNDFLLELIAGYQKEGWEMHNQSFGLGATDDLPTERVAYFVFSR